jgi:2-dehydropantoate 2-reductase
MDQNNTKANNTDLKSIGVIGMGPIGIILALHFQELGYDVAVCEKDLEKLEIIKNEGIILENTINKKCSLSKCFSSVSDFKGMDLDFLLFSLKSHQMQYAIKDAVALKTEKLGVISAQNGIDVENLLSDEFGVDNTLKMILNVAGNLKSPNRVNVTFFNPPNYIAALGPPQEKKAEILAKDLTDLNLETQIIDPVVLKRKIWGKAALNSSISAICGIGKFTMKEAMEMPETLLLIQQGIKETVEVAESEGIQFEDDFVERALNYLRRAGNHFPSLAADLLNNRKTEIDFFNGKIVEYGRKNNIRTPLNITFTNLVNAISKKSLSSKKTED